MLQLPEIGSVPYHETYNKLIPLLPPSLLYLAWQFTIIMLFHDVSTTLPLNRINPMLSSVFSVIVVLSMIYEYPGHVYVSFFIVIKCMLFRSVISWHCYIKCPYPFWYSRLTSRFCQVTHVLPLFLRSLFMPLLSLRYCLYPFTERIAQP